MVSSNGLRQNLSSVNSEDDAVSDKILTAMYLAVFCPASVVILYNYAPGSVFRNLNRGCGVSRRHYAEFNCCVYRRRRFYLEIVCKG